MFLIYPPEESNVYIQESKDGELEGMDRCRALNVVNRVRMRAIPIHLFTSYSHFCSRTSALATLHSVTDRRSG